jgi:hypothetical protein
VDYLAEEFANDCPAIGDVMVSLADLSNVSPSQVILDHLMRLPSEFRIDLRGRTLQCMEREHGFQLWRLLHEAGVLNAVVPDRRETREFRHIHFYDMPGLVSAARWNDLQAMQWEIHPAYRSYLEGIRENEAARIGLSSQDIVSRRRQKDRE